MLNKFLTFLIVCIVIFGIAGTAIALRKGAKVGADFETYREENEKPGEGKFGKDGSYNLIGRLWIPLKEDKARATVIVSPYLEYDGDREVYEEMEAKHNQIRNAITQFFSERTAAELKKLGEDEVKSSIAKKVNEIIVLGKVKKVWFNDYQFLEE